MKGSVLAWMPMKANPEARTWGQVVFLGRGVKEREVRPGQQES